MWEEDFSKSKTKNKMAKLGLKWGLLCAAFLLISLSTPYVLGQDDDDDDDEEESPNTAICQGAIDEGTVKTMEECESNIANDMNPDGTPKGVNCGDGLIVPIWRPYTKLTGGDRFGRGLLYVLLMVYLFIGVAIVSDRFMESIEMITAQEKEVTVKDPKSGKNQVYLLPHINVE